MSRAAQAATLVKVGARVGVRFVGRLYAGIIVEDRGYLGPKQQQVVRVEAEDPEVQFDLEIPVDWLEKAPPR